jgi:hypothetical protein
LSEDSSRCKTEKRMSYATIYDKFIHGFFEVPCSRLEFQDYDEYLNADIQNASTEVI